MISDIQPGFPKPFEIHVYHGSSFNPKEKWVCKGYDEIYGFFQTQDMAICKAREIARGFLFPMHIWVFQFWGGIRKRTRLIITRG